MDWSGLDEVDASEFILRCAVRDRAGEILISRDSQGCNIFFLSGDDLTAFGHVPTETSSRICRYLKQIVAIDPYLSAPQQGVGAIVLDGAEYGLTVSTIVSMTGEDLRVRLTRLENDGEEK